LGAGDVSNYEVWSNVCGARARNPLPQPENDDSIRNLEYLLKVVADDNYGQTSLLQSQNKIEHLALLGHTERRGRLI
jgi:hypothetical protein